MKIRNTILILAIAIFLFANIHYVMHKDIKKRQEDYFSNFNIELDTNLEIARLMKQEFEQLAKEDSIPYCFCVGFEGRALKYVDKKLYTYTKNGWKRISKRLIMKRFIDRYYR